MIKEEFILMINKELTNLEKDFREKIKILNDNPNRSEDVHYQLNLIERKISSLRRLVDLPVYARIQAMSDVEIEDYKQGKIGELELKIRKIQAMKAEEVKEQLNSELKGNHDLAKTMEFYKEIVDPSIELKASSVATDTEKAQQMATLLALYKGLSDDLNRIKCTVDLGSELPEELQTRLVVFYDSKSNELQYPDKALETVQEFEENFKRTKKIFREEFTEQKLSKLLDIYRKNDSYEVDMNFLQLFDPSGDKLDNLQSLIERRDKLLKKIFKTKKDKIVINYLNYMIEKEKSNIYQGIIAWYEAWYENQCKFILGINHKISYFNLDELKNSLERCGEDIIRSEQVIMEVKEKIQQAKTEMEQQINNYEAKKDEIAQQIRDLAGEKFKEFAIPYASGQKNKNLDSIIDAQILVYNRDIINRVEQEAQNQADITEAELRGITVPQLLQMKQQAQTMVEADGEDSSQVLKR